MIQIKFKITFQEKTNFITLTIENNSRHFIGRESQWLLIESPKVSRKHCSLYLKDNLLFIEDEKSLAGTTLNGMKIGKSILSNGDSIQLADVTLEVLSLQIAKPPVKKIRSLPPSAFPVKENTPEMHFLVRYFILGLLLINILSLFVEAFFTDKNVASVFLGLIVPAGMYKVTLLLYLALRLATVITFQKKQWEAAQFLLRISFVVFFLSFYRYLVFSVDDFKSLLGAQGSQLEIGRLKSILIMVKLQYFMMVILEGMMLFLVSRFTPLYQNTLEKLSIFKCAHCLKRLTRKNLVGLKFFSESWIQCQHCQTAIGPSKTTINLEYYAIRFMISGYLLRACFFVFKSEPEVLGIISYFLIIIGNLSLLIMPFYFFKLHPKKD